jgi:curved DNA-binding protein
MAAVKFKDYYEVIGVKRDAAPEEIKSQYRKLARKFHPDLNKTDKSAEARFREVQEAYEVLGDPEKRRRYDQLGSGYSSGMDFDIPGSGGPFQRESAAGGGLGGFSEFFDMLLGGAGMRSRASATAAGGARRPTMMRNGRDIETELPVTIEDIFTGATKKVRVQVSGTCSACQGAGVIAGSPCGACSGRGVAPRSKTIDLRIPPHVKDGLKLRLTGQGELANGTGGKNGDMLIRIRVEPHPVFRIDGRDISVDLPVAPWEAVLGAEVDVPTLDGSVKMKLPPGTQAGKKLRLRQRGMRNEGGTRGDQIVVVQVVVPEEVTDRERHLFRQLRDISHFRPRVKDRTTN